MTRVHGASNGGAPRRSLLLAGGGMRVAYQAGVIKALIDHGLTFEHADGTSGGIMNLAMLLSGLSPDEMCARWRTLDVHDFVSAAPASEYLKGPAMLALGDADGIREKVFPHLGIDPACIRAAEGIQGTFNVCNYTRKVNEAIPHRQVELDHLIAGVSLPLLMPPVRIGEDLYLDSVWIKDTNVMEAVARGAEELWLVWCIGNHGEYRGGVFDQYVHMIEMSANGVLNEELDRVREINERIAGGEPVGGRIEPIRLHVIRPAYPLPLDPDYFLGHIDGATLVAMGYRDAKGYLARTDPAGVAPGPEATRMATPPPGITFRETMRGFFSMGVDDPEEGARRGEEAGTELALHGTIEIDDLERFVSDPEHTGSIAGHVESALVGGMVPASAGVFKLFSPTRDPQLKLMVYELAFEHEGQAHYLSGRKEVRDDPGFDLWADTTTLYARLHRGSSVEGPAVGAGILKLDMSGFMKMLRTVRATGGGSAASRARRVARFGGFFFGSLWERYAQGGDR